jgi:hypothetical protein
MTSGAAAHAGLEVGGARVVWDLERLRAVGPGDEAAWRIETEPDWSTVEALRLLWASFEDGSGLAVAALRPTGAAGHDAEAVAGFLVDPEGEPRPLQEVLISTEHGPDGAPRRLGLELYEEEGAIPLRVAADGEREVSVRIDGRAGKGRYEVLTGPDTSR